MPEELSSYTELSGIGLEHPREIAAYILSSFNKSNAYKDLMNAMNLVPMNLVPMNLSNLNKKY